MDIDPHPDVGHQPLWAGQLQPGHHPVGGLDAADPEVDGLAGRGRGEFPGTALKFGHRLTPIAERAAGDPRPGTLGQDPAHPLIISGATPARSGNSTSMTLPDRSRATGSPEAAA